MKFSKDWHDRFYISLSAGNLVGTSVTDEEVESIILESWDQIESSRRLIQEAAAKHEALMADIITAKVRQRPAAEKDKP